MGNRRIIPWLIANNAKPGRLQTKPLMMMLQRITRHLMIKQSAPTPSISIFILISTMEYGQNYGITVLHPQRTSTINAENERDLIFECVHTYKSVLEKLIRGISLVAIHGLAGDPFTTWTHVKGHPMWLRDLLPQVMPNIRIMTYGYNTSFLNYTAKQDVRSIAAKLLAELADLRSGEEVSM